MTIQTDPQYKLRMPPELHEKLKSAAKNHHRSMNAEIVARLQSTFEYTRPSGPPVLDDLGNTTEEEKALKLRLAAMHAALDTLHSETQALALAAERVERSKDQAAEQQGKADEGADDS